MSGCVQGAGKTVLPSKKLFYEKFSCLAERGQHGVLREARHSIFAHRSLRRGAEHWGLVFFCKKKSTDTHLHTSYSNHSQRIFRIPSRSLPRHSLTNSPNPGNYDGNTAFLVFLHFLSEKCGSACRIGNLWQHCFSASQTLPSKLDRSMTQRDKITSNDKPLSFSLSVSCFW